MKYLKTILVFTVLLISNIHSAFAELSRDELKSGLIPDSRVLGSGGVGDGAGEGMVDGILGFVRDSIFGLMALIAIGMFLYIGGRLVIARGNPEEFKKALTSFVYAGIGIFTVAAALAIVRFIAGVNL